MRYDLLDTYSCATHGSFASLSEARDYAMSLREFGLCQGFRIGGQKDKVWQSFYESKLDSVVGKLIGQDITFKHIECGACQHQFKTRYVYGIDVCPVCETNNEIPRYK